MKDSIKINVLISPETINLGNDTTLCTGNQLILNAKSGFRNYLWQNNAVDSNFTVTQPGTYFVTASDYCNTIFSDTIHITYNQASAITLGNDTSICNNKPIVLNAGPNFISYLWNTGETTPFITVNNTGNYWVTATNNYGCQSKDTLKIIAVSPSPALLLKKQTTLCLNQNNTLNVGSGYTSYLWQNGATDSSIVVTRPGVYTITVSNNYNCFASDSVKIVKIALPPGNFLDSALAICSDDTISIIPHTIFKEYLWSTGSTNNILSIHQPGKYWLMVKDKNSCTGTDTISIFLKDCSPHFYIPNAFTPNSDGRNDTFKPIVSGRIEEYEFKIYNRYGQLVFSTQSSTIGWDGTVKSTTQNSGVFAWHCRYKIKNEAVKFIKGTVLLIR